MKALVRYFRSLSLLSLFFVFAIDSLSAQEISVKSFRLLETDLTANTAGTMKRDQNNETAALIKVVTKETGFVFDGGMLGIVATMQKTGEIWVYVPQKARKITISHQQLGVLRDYPYPCSIEAGRTYEMVLTTGRVTTVVHEDAGGQYVAMTVTPANAEVYIDDMLVESGGGSVSQLLKYGKHTYRVVAPLYETDMGQFTISSQGRTDLQVSLRPAYGQLQITSEPVGAEVYIDGDYKPAGTTPFTTERLPKGSHKLQFKLASYKPYTENVVIAGDGSIQSKSVTLAPNFAVVSIAVPENAEIFVNEELKGVGSWQGRLNAGLYTVEARKTSHYSSKQSIEVRAGENQHITLSAPVPRYGSININTRPMGATVSIDGQLLGESPNIFKNVLIGQHTLTVSKEGYATHSQTIDVEEGKVLPVDLSLESGGTVVLTSNIPHTRIYIDGIYVGVAPYTHNAGAGRYSVTAKAYGYDDVTRSVVVVAGQRNTEMINPKPQTGTVQITTLPSSSKIYIDGSYVGTSPYFFEARSGSYSVMATSYGYKPKSQEITVQAGQTTSETLYLKAKRKRLMDYYDAGDLFSLGGAWDILWTDKCSMGGYVSFKMGQEQFTWLTAVLNIGGYKMGKNRGGKFLKEEGDPEIAEIDTENAKTTYAQFPISLALRLRLGGGDWGATYIGAHASYNFNLGNYNYNVVDNVYTNIINSRNYSVGAQFGFCIKRIIDITFFYTHDLRPAYNQQYIYENMPDFYNTFESHINKRWRIGTSFAIYIPFSGEW